VFPFSNANHSLRLPVYFKTVTFAPRPRRSGQPPPALSPPRHLND
jgi:hypothetical protein